MALTLLAGLLATTAQAQTVSEDTQGACWDYGVWYESIAEDWGVRAYGNSMGVNLNDFDGDGLLDIFVAQAPSRASDAAYYPGESLLYLQRDDLRFDEVGAERGVDDLCEDRSPLYGDLDNDGLPDLYLTVNGRNVLYRNDGWSYFDDVTAWSGATDHPGWGHQGFLLDADGDGWLDIFFTNGPEDGSGTNTLLLNERVGTFRDVSEAAGVAGDTSGKGACVLDADLDGLPDVFVTTGREFGNHLYMNQGDGTFVDEAAQRGVADPLQRFGVGANCGDMDNDGDPDILVITHDATWTGNQLFENRDGTFVDVAPQSGDGVSDASLQDRIDPHGSALVDLDLDGDLDVVLSGFAFQPHVYLNQGALTFRRACGSLGMTANDLLSWGVSAADFTGDGYPEVYISNGLGLRPRDDELFAYVGDGGHHWLGIDVVGLSHNPSALGAKVEVKTADKTVTRWVGGWSSFDSQGPLRVTVGLAGHETADVTVTFTNGEVATLTDVAADQVVSIDEPITWADADHDGVEDDWDACPGTVLGRLTDGEGCAVGQRGGLAVALADPAPNDVITDCFTLRWTGDVGASAVVQISADGTFGVTERIDFGPVTGGELEICGEELALLRSISDGSKALAWRVATVDDDGNEATSLPGAFYVALPVPDVTVPLGANIFEPAHIVVDSGTTVTWWNDSVTAGNLQNEPHDVQLVDAGGNAITHMHTLEGAGAFSYDFMEAGIWHYICHRHSGVATNHDGVHETNQFTHHETDGPYRCMSGTVTVQ